MASPVVVAGVTTVYPSEAAPTSGTFVRSLFRAMRERGVATEIVAPYSRTRALITGFRSSHSARSSVTTDDSLVRRPGYWSLPSVVTPGTNIALRVTLNEFRRAAHRELLDVAKRATFIYCHFFVAGWAALSVGEELGVPVMLALGESAPEYYEGVFGGANVQQTLSRFSGIVTVSKKNEAFCRARVAGIGDALRYLPNAVDIAAFTPRNRQEARKLLKLPIDGEIAIFVGHFIERKGPLLVARAIETLEGVRGIFLGRGPQVPQGRSVLHTGTVVHEEMPFWLAAADIFVLPSLAEGMSNAIVEALACGLPVVVSDRSFNHEFLDSSCAVFVDPESESAIADGVRFLLADADRRRRMAIAARRRAEQLSLTDRAQAILDFGCELAQADLRSPRRARLQRRQ
jgi:teichuronic acid biosynthesis glycosyltransferase TuaC